MAVKVSKVCMIGDFGVGKTSLVARFVHSTFSDAYLTTVGVKIDTRELTLSSGDRVKLVLWDIAGTDVLSTVESRYLKGAAAYLFVADGTRPKTLDSVVSLHAQVNELLGEAPFRLLLNKADLEEQWALDEATIPARWDWSKTSAKTGDGVEAAFEALAEAIWSAE
jgi:small GTP-binding protein